MQQIHEAQDAPDVTDDGKNDAKSEVKQDEPDTRTDPVRRRILLGMVHLPPLPGSPGAAGRRSATVIEEAFEHAARDVRAILEGGMDGFIIENFGDVPFYPGPVPPVTVAAMATLATRLADFSRDLESDGHATLIGANVLRNDAAAALAVAAAADLDFIRINVHCGAMVTDQGVVEGQAAETLRERERLGCPVRILADVLVKHASPLGSIAEPGALSRDIAYRGLADGLIVTGHATGSPTDSNIVKAVRAAVPDRVIFVGSGVRVDSVRGFLSHANGVIVGTGLKAQGDPSNPVDEDTVGRLVDVVRDWEEGL